VQPWLYIVILGACIIVYANMRPKEAQSKRTAVVNDIESALEQFAEDLEEGNKELMISVSGLKRELEAEINKLNGRLSVLENHNPISNIGLIELPKTTYIIQEKEEQTEKIVTPASNIDTIVPQPQPLENDIKNRYGSIFELHDQGKSIEYIAKKTGMNKGEIQLIIQLARQEEQFRV
jgi:hypothetical protein